MASHIAPYGGARWVPGYGGTAGLFRSLFRFAMPLVKSVGKKIVRSVGRKALKQTVGLASDALRGKNMKQAIKRRMVNTLADITENDVPRKRSKQAPVSRNKKVKQSGRVGKAVRSKNVRKQHQQDIFS